MGRFFQVVHFDVAEHCAARHVQTFPFRCGNDQCTASFSSIFRFVKHAAVLHAQTADNSTASLIVNNAQLTVLENSIDRCFGRLNFDDS